MDPIQRIAPRIPGIPSVEPVAHRIDPEQQKREQQERERRRREPELADQEEPEEDDGLPHIDVRC